MQDAVLANSPFPFIAVDLSMLITSFMLLSTLRRGPLARDLPIRENLLDVFLKKAGRRFFKEASSLRFADELFELS